MTVDLYPAIDIRGGQVVRLRQGDYDNETVYGDDPVQVAVTFADAGATWIHIVDLDAARSGDAVNRPVIADIVRGLDGRCAVQNGGGVRTAADAAALAEIGVRRVVMGSAAVTDPDRVAKISDIVDVAVGLDHRDGVLAVHGWTTSTDVRLVDALDWFPTAAGFVITDIHRDGMLQGPDIDGLRAAAAVAAVPVIASGGIATLADIAACAQIPNVGGVITGKAIYEGRFTVADAIMATQRGGAQ